MSNKQLCESLKKLVRKWYLNHKKINAIKKRYDLVSYWWKKLVYLILLLEVFLYGTISFYHDGIGENGEHYFKFFGKMFYIGFIE